jgi:hypothetical protein
MTWPNQKALERQRKEFDENGGPERVARQILGLPSITKHKDTGEPWPAFHRCSLCGEHAEVMGERCVKVGPQHNMNYCEYCVTEMYKAVTR